MKKIFNYSILLLCSLVMGLTGCKKQELVFPYEKLHFETKADAILLEVTVPSGTGAKDDIYVVGAFNGNKVSPEYKLVKHEETDIKFGIYLYAEDFVEGFTLADGFHFEDATLGKEVYEQEHVIANAVAGQRYEISFSRWNTTTKPIVPGEYSNLYVLGNVEGTDWTPAEPLELTMVGTDIFRGELTFTGSDVSYFAIITEVGASNDDWATVNANRWGANNTLLEEDAVVDLQKQDGSDQNVTIVPGTYVITVNMAKKIIYIGEEEPGGEPEKPSKYEHLYILGNVEGTGWTPAEPLELKKVGRDLFRGEFTFVPDGTNTICYFAFATEKGATNDDWATLNAARWGGGELKEGEYLPLTLQTSSDMTVTIAPGTYTITVNMIFKEAVIGEGDWSGREEPKDDPEPEPDPDPIIVPDTITTHVYFKDVTTVDMSYVYSWGNDDQGQNQQIFGGWPGTKWTEWEKVTFLGETLYHYSFDAVEGQECHFIINGVKDQINDAVIFTVGKKTDIFLQVGDDADHTVELVPTPAGELAPRRK